MAQVTIPPLFKREYMVVEDILNDKQFSHYTYQPTLAAQPGEENKKVQVAVKVFVPEPSRIRVTADLADALEALPEIQKGFVIKKPNQLDLVVAGTPGQKGSQVIRISIKPENSGGSGGGSKATEIQETGMCLYAALRFRVPPFNKGPLQCHPNKPEECIDEEDYKKAYDFVEPKNKVGWEDIATLPQEWKNSFIMGANLLHDNFGKYHSGKYRFVRGDNSLDDGVIKKAYTTIIKPNTKLSSEDKWNPSDIWMYLEGYENKIREFITEEGTVDCLNNFFQDTMNPEDLPRKTGKNPLPMSLIGVSLKKIDETPTLKVLNRVSLAERRKSSKVEYNENVTKNNLIFDNNRKDKPYPMDVYFYYGTGAQDRFQARNFAGDKAGDWKFELKGAAAAQGKIQGSAKGQTKPNTPLYKVLEDAGFAKSSLPSIPTWDSCKPHVDRNGNLQDNIPKSVQDITNEIYKGLKDNNARGLNKYNEAESKTIINLRSQSYRFSKLCGLRWLKWFNTESDSSRAMRELYLYAASQGEGACIHYKLM
jgi:hypothetical protein